MAGCSRGCDDDISKVAALRELEKARVRECQMEKTVRWWTVCTAGWRKKWSKLRQENEELRKQIKTYKSQVAERAQVDAKLERAEAQNGYLKGEINKLIAKHGQEQLDERVLQILSSDDAQPDSETEARKKINKSITATPETERQMILDEIKNVEIYSEMMSKIFTEMETLKDDIVKHKEELVCKELTDFSMSNEQIAQLKLFTLYKQIEKEQLEKQELIKKLELANSEISNLHSKIEEMTAAEYFIDPESKAAMENLTLSDEE